MIHYVCESRLLHTQNLSGSNQTDLGGLRYFFAYKFDRILKSCYKPRFYNDFAVFG